MPTLNSYKLEKYFIFPDVHMPYQDDETLKSAFHFCKDFNPDHIIQLGDLLDCYALSSYCKDPTRILSFQREIDLGKNFWKKLSQICPDAQKHYKLGNHERRFQTLLYSKPELSPLKALSWESLMDLERYNVKLYKEHQKLVFNNKLVITHGSFVSGNSGASALKELLNRRMSGVSGHVHRAAKVFDTKGDGTCCWVESGFLGKLGDHEGFEFMGDKAINWQQATSSAIMWKDEKENWQVKIDLHEAHDHCFIYNNKMYTPNGIVELT